MGKGKVIEYGVGLKYEFEGEYLNGLKNGKLKGYNKDNHLDDVICVHKRCGTWIDDTYNKQNLNNYSKEKINEYFDIINKLNNK